MTTFIPATARSTVVMPWLFGRPEAESTVPESLRSIARICVSREFSMFALGRTSSVATWLRSLARELDGDNFIAVEFPACNRRR